jgi:hypothetical protein
VNILGLRVSTHPLKYLGLPLGSFKSRAGTDGVMEKMEKRLVS